MRCFIGVPVDHHLALELLTHRDKGLQALDGANPRPISARNFHLTLAFLGDLSADVAAAVGESLAHVAQNNAAFLQPLTNVCRFPTRQGRYLVAEGGACAALLALKRAVDNELASHKVKADPRPIRPHITLVRSAVAKLAVPDWTMNASVNVSEIVLYESVSGVNAVGAEENEYCVVARHPLRTR